MSTVETPRLVLHHPRPGDETGLVATWTDPAVARFMDDFGPRTPPGVRRWVSEVSAAAEPQPGDRPGSVQFSVVDRESGACIGWLGLGHSGRGLAEWDFGYALDPRHRGRGVMAEALRAGIAACRADFGVSTFWGECHADNDASARTMLAAGLTEIGPGADGSRRFATHPGDLRPELPRS